MNMDLAPASDEKIASLKTINHVTYALYALSLFGMGTPAIVAIVLNYIKRDDAQGTWLESHFRWQIGTFWWSVVWCVVGFITFPLLFLGVVVWGVAFVWFVYRIAKGWLNLNDNKPMLLQ
jgi:uncharacterized membrane protein